MPCHYIVPIGGGMEDKEIRRHGYKGDNGVIGVGV